MIDLEVRRAVARVLYDWPATDPDVPITQQEVYARVRGLTQVDQMGVDAVLHYLAARRVLVLDSRRGTPFGVYILQRRRLRVFCAPSE